MSNIQKNFKQKAKCGLRAFALGGMPAQQPIQNTGVGILENSADNDWNAAFDARRAAEQRPPEWDGTGADGVRRPALARQSIMPPVRAFELGGSLRSMFGGKPAPTPVAAPVEDSVSRAQAALAASRAKYGGVPSTPDPVAATAPVAPAPVAAPAPTIQGAAQTLRGRAAAIDAATRYEHGGKIEPYVDGSGFIHGEKGIDKVPAKVAQTGEDILVGDGERIVNQDQNKALESLARKATGQPLDDYLEDATGQQVGPKTKKGLRAAANGWLNDVGDTMANMVKSPDRRAMDAGTATPEQTAREEHGMQRAFSTDSPYDVALPMAPMTALRSAGPSAGPGVVDSAMSAAKNAASSVASTAGDAVRGIRGMLGKKAAAPVAAEAEKIAPIVAPEKWSAEASAHLTQRAAQDKAFAAATTAGKATPSAGKEFVAAPAANAALQATSAPSKYPAATEAPAAAAATAPTTAAPKWNAEDNPNVRSLRSAGVQGDVGGDDFEWKKDGLERYAPSTGKTGIRTIDTVNGRVYAGRDANGQLNVVSNVGQSAKDSETARAAEATRMTADLKRQSDTFDKLALERDMKSNNPADRESAAQRVGLRQLDAQIAQASQANETTRRGQDLTLQAHQIDHQTKLATLKNQQAQQNFEQYGKNLDGLFGKDDPKNDPEGSAKRREFENDIMQAFAETGVHPSQVPVRDLAMYKKLWEQQKDAEPGPVGKAFRNWVLNTPWVKDPNVFRQLVAQSPADGLGFSRNANGSPVSVPSAVGKNWVTGEYDRQIADLQKRGLRNQ